MDLGDIMSAWTVVALVLFVAIVIWAWSGKRRQSFEEAARIPLENDDETITPEATLKENNHV